MSKRKTQGAKMSKRKTRRSAAEVLTSVESNLLQQIVESATVEADTVEADTVEADTVEADTEATTTEPTVPEVSQEEIASAIANEQMQRDAAQKESLVELNLGVVEVAKGDASYRIGRLMGFKHFSRYIQLQYASGQKDRGTILKGIEASLLPVSREKIEVERGLLAYWAWNIFGEEDNVPGSEEVPYTSWYDTWGILLTRRHEKTPRECYDLIDGISLEEATSLFGRYVSFRSKEGREETKNAIKEVIAIAAKRMEAMALATERQKGDLKDRQKVAENRLDELQKEIELARTEGKDVSPLIQERETLNAEWKEITTEVVAVSDAARRAASSADDANSKLKKMSPSKKEKTLLGNIDPKLFMDAAPYDLAKVLCHMMTENKDPSLALSCLIDRLFTSVSGSKFDKSAQAAIAAAYWSLEESKRKAKK